MPGPLISGGKMAEPISRMIVGYPARPSRATRGRSLSYRWDGNLMIEKKSPVEKVLRLLPKPFPFLCGIYSIAP
jgi:hypothetical protein